jgi:hypothetical protein
MNIKGTIKTIADIQTFDSGFRKQEFVIETTEDKFPQLVKFEITKDNIEKFDPFLIEGGIVNVHFNIRGNEFNGKVYNSLQCWKLEN